MPGDKDYFEGNQYDNDLIYNVKYNQNDLMEGMEICNITLMRGDMVKTNIHTEKGNEATFVDTLLNNIV